MAENPNIVATDDEGNELANTDVEVNGVVPGSGGGGGAFEDTDGDGVAELQESHADFQGGQPRDIGSVSEQTIVENSGTDYAIDLSRGGVYYVTLTANVTFSLAGEDAGLTNSVTVFLEQDSTGGRSITWPTGVLWSGGSAPALTTNAGDIHSVSFIHANGSWFGFLGGENFA